MEKYTTKIPIHQENIKAIIEAFQDGDFNYWENFKEHPTTTHNGRGAAIWNEIFTELEKKFTKDGFQVGKFNRGFWQVLFIYEEKTKYLYTFMRYKNFVSLQNKSPQNRLMHYCNLLSKVNGKLVGTYQVENEQLCFLPNVFSDNSADTEMQEMLNIMLSKIQGEVERYAIVLVKQERGKVQDIECKIPIEGLECIYTESWKDCITFQYEDEDYSSGPLEAEETEILLFNKEGHNLEVVQKKKRRQDKK